MQLRFQLRILLPLQSLFMRLNPHTTVGSLLTAIPSSAMVFEELGITVKGNRDKSLQEVCADAGVAVESFFQALDEIDWSKESLYSENLNAS